MSATSDIEAAAAPPPHPTLAEATWVWLKIGVLSFGGPAGQIALMHRMLVDERRWISEPRFLHALNYCMLLPGPEAQQLATYVGWLLHGVRGGVIAGLLFILPGLAVIFALSAFYALVQEAAWVESLFFGLKAAVLAIVIEAVWRLGRRALKGGLSIALAAGAFVAIFALGAPFPLIVLAAALIGLTAARLRPAPGEPASGGEGAADAVIESRLTRIAPSLGGAIRAILICGALWAAAPLLAAAAFGWDSVFTPISVFFSKMAVVTFGGAYAVLAYVAQQAVEAYGWLTPPEMLDGLALAETTPGPLILVLPFVGFLAAYRDPAGLDPLLAGFLGGGLTAWVTFAPCFLWIFLGAPYAEGLRRNRALSGALSGITAAVVGVVLNLAVWFGLHVLFREVGRLELGPIRMAWPELGSADPLGIALAALAALALLRLKLGMIWTLALCGGLGWAAKSLLV